MNDILLIYVTCINKNQAKDIGLKLLEKKLCACINIIPETHASYFWPPKSGKIASETEAVLLVKTLRDKQEQVITEIKKLHSDEVPCIIVIPSQVNDEYLEWMNGEIK